MEKTVWKDRHLHLEKIADIIRTYDSPKKILIVFWHGVGDTLMFLPVYDYLCDYFPDHHFDLSLLPGVGQSEYLPGSLAIPEHDFVANHDVAFVVSFPMNEGSDERVTKAQFCCLHEFGMPLPQDDQTRKFLLKRPHGCSFNRLVGIHLQGTCLPGSTNPDDRVAQMIWDDIIAAGGIPIDLHFEHAFHNPVNTRQPWVTRNCRDLKPSLTTLQMMMERCAAVVAVASGPFVLALSLMPDKLIYLQKHHRISCYVVEPFESVIDLNEYGSDGQGTLGLTPLEYTRTLFRGMVQRMVFGRTITREAVERL